MFSRVCRCGRWLDERDLVWEKVIKGMCDVMGCRQEVVLKIASLVPCHVGVKCQDIVCRRSMRVPLRPRVSKCGGVTEGLVVLLYMCMHVSLVLDLC